MALYLPLFAISGPPSLREGAGGPADIDVSLGDAVRSRQSWAPFRRRRGEQVVETGDDQGELRPWPSSELQTSSSFASIPSIPRRWAELFCWPPRVLAVVRFGVAISGTVSTTFSPYPSSPTTFLGLLVRRRSS